MAIAVDAHRRQRAKGLEGLSDSSDRLFADARILLGECIGYKSAVQDAFPRPRAEALERERRPVREAPG